MSVLSVSVTVIHIYRVTTSDRAPRVALRDPAALGGGFVTFDGSSKGALSPAAPFEVVDEVCREHRQFFQCAPGLLVGDAKAIFECKEMYYATLGTEHLAMRGIHRSLVGINPLDALPSPRRGTAPCVVDKFYAPLFRIQGQNCLDLFCVEGFEVPRDEFKCVSDEFGFSGLEFEDFWVGQRG